MVREGVAAGDVTVGSELQAEGGLEERVAPKNGIEEAENENEPGDLDGLGRLTWHGIECVGLGLWKSHPLGRPEKLR